MVAVFFFMLMLLLAYFVNFRADGIMIDGFFDLIDRKNNLEFTPNAPSPKPEPDCPRYIMLGDRFFDAGTEFFDDFAIVSIDNEKYALKRDGSLYSVANIYGQYLRNGYFIYQYNGVKGLRHIIGKTILPARFDTLIKGVDFLLARYQDY